MRSSSQDKLKITFFYKLSFFVFGVSSLSGWNAILTGLDYFKFHFQDYDSAFYFPVPMFLATAFVGITLPKLSIYFSLSFRMLGGLVILCLLLVTLPLVAYLLPNSNGFYLALVNILFMGFFNSLVQNSSIGIASILGGEYVNNFLVGTGMSGTIICIFRVICLASFPENKTLSAMIYFAIAIAWNIFAVLIYLKFTKTRDYRYVLQEHKKSFREDILVIKDEDIDDGVLLKDKLGLFTTFWEVSKRAFPTPLGIFIIYVQTFTMFPGLTLEKNFSFMDNSWGQTLLILSYNIFDTLGKLLSGYKSLQNLPLLMSIVMIRFLFFALFILIVTGYIMVEWFPFVNIALYALLNGFATGGLMTLGPQMVNDIWKEKVGFIQAFALQFGIMVGTFCAIPLQSIKQNN